jgi:hypothetical protein
MQKKKVLKALVLPLLVLALLVALWIGAGVGVIYYNNHLSPPARLRDQVKLGQQYQTVYKLFTDYGEKYKNDPNVSVGQGITDKRVADALKISQGKRLHLFHSIFVDDIELTVYFDGSDRVAHIEYVGD